MSVARVGRQHITSNATTQAGRYGVGICFRPSGLPHIVPLYDEINYALHVSVSAGRDAVQILGTRRRRGAVLCTPPPPHNPRRILDSLSHLGNHGPTYLSGRFYLTYIGRLVRKTMMSVLGSGSRACHHLSRLSWRQCCILHDFRRHSVNSCRYCCSRRHHETILVREVWSRDCQWQVSRPL